MENLMSNFIKISHSYVALGWHYSLSYPYVTWLDKSFICGIRLTLLIKLSICDMTPNFSLMPHMNDLSYVIHNDMYDISFICGIRLRLLVSYPYVIWFTYNFSLMPHMNDLSYVIHNDMYDISFICGVRLRLLVSNSYVIWCACNFRQRPHTNKISYVICDS